jgi:hypothetical protein
VYSCSAAHQCGDSVVVIQCVSEIVSEIVSE